MSALPDHATHEGSALPSQEGRLQTPQEQGVIPGTNVAGRTRDVDEDDIESQARSQRRRRDLLQQEIEIETMEQ
jgi:Ribonuclease G/E